MNYFILCVTMSCLNWVVAMFISYFDQKASWTSMASAGVFALLAIACGVVR